MVAVINRIKVYERNGKELQHPGDEEVYIDSHWNRDVLVVLRIGDESYTVSANHLRAAIDNATNTARFLL